LADVAYEFEWVSSPELPDAGTYRREAAKRWIAAWVESFEEFTAEATEIIDAGDKVFVAILQRGGVRGSQTVVEGHWWIVVVFGTIGPSAAEDAQARVRDPPETRQGTPSALGGPSVRLRALHGSSDAWPGAQLAKALNEPGVLWVSCSSREPSALMANSSLPFGAASPGSWTTWRWNAIQ
jgi:hypothetical protein